MTAIAGFTPRLLLDDISLSAHARSGATTYSVEALDVTVMDDAGVKSFVPGVTEAQFSADGPMDTDATADGAYDTLTDVVDAGTNVPITYANEGLTEDLPCRLVDGFAVSYDISATPTGTVDYNLSAQIDGTVGFGKIGASGAVTVSTNGTAIDMGGATSNGAAVHLHVTAYDSLTSNTVSIEDSADGSTGWATIGTFTAATGRTSERILISGSVRQYIRVVDTVVGSGSCTRTVGYAAL